MIKLLQAFHREEEAATAVEYAVMLMLIVTVCIVAIQSVGTEASEFMTDNQTKIGNAMSNGN